jgi:hypothetical protein
MFLSTTTTLTNTLVVTGKTFNRSHSYKGQKLFEQYASGFVKDDKELGVEWTR